MGWICMDTSPKHNWIKNHKKASYNNTLIYSLLRCKIIGIHESGTSTGKFTGMIKNNVNISSQG